MTQEYFDPARESDPYALPDVEIFQVDSRGYSNGEPFVLGHEPGDQAFGLAESGWYWQAGTLRVRDKPISRRFNSAVSREQRSAVSATGRIQTKSTRKPSFRVVISARLEMLVRGLARILG